jgi:hypothetical protein
VGVATVLSGQFHVLGHDQRISKPTSCTLRLRGGQSGFIMYGIEVGLL